MKKTCIRFISALLLLAIGSALAYSSTTESGAALPVTTIDLKTTAIVGIDNWRIVGAFPLPASDQIYTANSEEASFAHDYLADIHGSEMPLELPPLQSAESIDFSGNTWIKRGALTKTGKFLNQNQQFPSPAVSSQLLFWHSFETFKILYAASALYSLRDTDAVFVVASNSPIKVWLNNRVIATPYPGSVGHEENVRWLIRVHLSKGSNSLLLKEFCFPLRNDFAFRVLAPSRASKFIDEHGGIRDVIDQILIPRDGLLALSTNLRFFAKPASTNDARVDIRDIQGRVVSRSVLNLQENLAIPTHGLPDGLYSIHAFVGRRRFSEEFFVGSTADLLNKYNQLCVVSQHAASDNEIDPCVVLPLLRSSVQHMGPAPRLDLDSKILFLISQIEWNLHHVHPETQVPGDSRTQLVSYRSAVDNQPQYYYIHLPLNYNKNHPIPLVVITFFVADHSPFLVGGPTGSINALLQYASYADQFKYGVIVPFARALHYSPLSVVDILDAVKDATRRYSIDEKRLYLQGECGAGRDSILLAEKFPDHFAALSAINIATGVRTKASGTYWIDANNPHLYIQNLDYVPLQLINGDYFPHSPIDQAVTFKEECQQIGKKVDSVVLPRDGYLGEVDPLWLSFQFFRGKVLHASPSRVRFVTRQLKYNSDYWIQVTRLVNPTDLATIDAHWDSPNTITITTTNAAQIALLPDRFPHGAHRSGSLLVKYDGMSRNVSLLKAKSVQVDVIDPPTSNSAGLFKDHWTEGPISDAFAGQFLVVQGTGGAAWEQRESQRIVQEIASSWHDEYSGTCPQSEDVNLTKQDLESSNLIIVGKTHENTLVENVREKIPFVATSAGLQLGDLRLNGSHLLAVMVYPNPVTPHKYVVTVDFNGEGDLPYPELASSGVYDAIAWDLDSPPGPRALGNWYWNSLWKQPQGQSTVGQWYWDSNWSHLKADGVVH